MCDVVSMSRVAGAERSRARLSTEKHRDVVSDSRTCTTEYRRRRLTTSGKIDEFFCRIKCLKSEVVLFKATSGESGFGECGVLTAVHLNHTTAT